MAAPSCSSITLDNGAAMPASGYGLYQIPAGEAEAATQLAIDQGYRHLDSASFYGNERGVGAAIAKSGLREELFVASKVWTDCIGLGAAAVRSSVLRSLELLQVDYLDLCYVHWPVPGRHVEAYAALEDLVAEGKIKMLGLSNYRQQDYAELLPAMRVKPVVNQIEVNPWLHRLEVIEYFKAQGIATVAYKPLVRGAGLGDYLVVKLAAKYSVTPAQILLQWVRQHGHAVLAKSSNPQRIRENLEAPCRIADADIAALDALQKPEALVAYEAQFAKRSAVDATGPTLAEYSGRGAGQ